MAVHIFGLSGPVTVYHPTGSGDTTLDYIQVLCFLVTAGLGAIFWSLIDRSRPHYRTLYAWLRLLVRFTLAFTLLGYGFAKVYPLQFAPPFPSMLAQTYGEASPMGLLWTFMSASTPYRIFTGIAEVTAGVLLLFHRTAILGALSAAAVMLNVVLLNFCYDVPVKLYSSHLLLMSVFLLAPDAGALWRFLVLRVPSRLQDVGLPSPDRRRLRIAVRALHVLVVLSVLYGNVWGGYKMMKQRASSRSTAELEGIWDVHNFVVTGGSSPQVTPDRFRWRRLIVNTPTFSVVQTEAGERLNFRTVHDGAKHTLKLTARATQQQNEFTYERPDDKRLILRGSLERVPVTIGLSRYDTSKFLLMNRGFHWINEDPFNR
jgi:hypothetical protein